MTADTRVARGTARGNSPIGQRIHIVGISCSGKTTLASRLAALLRADFVDLDAINWLPNWVALNETDRPELERRFRAATQGERWVTAGSYTATAQRAFWPRLDTIVWLDLPAALLMWRCLRRSWRRWRAKELLWGTNVERFWPHLAVWRREDSLLWWIATQHRRKRRNTLTAMIDPRWSRIRFVRLKSNADIEAFIEQVVAKWGNQGGDMREDRECASPNTVTSRRV